jgi:Xaa-Pro aminopeptidase
MERVDELQHKLGRLRHLLSERRLHGALLASHAGFAWLTGGGRNEVSITTERGVAGILVTADEAVLVADNIERARLQEEELQGLSLPAVEYPWWSGSLQETVLARVPAGGLIADIPIPGASVFGPHDHLRLRNPLLPLEIERYRALGEKVGVVLTHAAFRCRPGLSEHQLAGMLAGGLVDFGITPAVTLVAVDGRISTRRHPLPTGRRLERYAMLVVGARRNGLNLSATRLVHFGPVPEELRSLQLACARVDAAFLTATRPGASFREVFAAGQRAYAEAGFPEEWQHHHQGGPTGYSGRDLRVTPTSEGEVQEGQAFAWNPSIAGVKSEDTVLVTRDGLEVLSATPDLPTVTIDGVERPGIVER